MIGIGLPVPPPGALPIRPSEVPGRVRSLRQTGPMSSGPGRSSVHRLSLSVTKRTDTSIWVCIKGGKPPPVLPPATRVHLLPADGARVSSA